MNSKNIQKVNKSKYFEVFIEKSLKIGKMLDLIITSMPTNYFYHFKNIITNNRYTSHKLETKILTFGNETLNEKNCKYTYNQGIDKYIFPSKNGIPLHN